MYFHLLLLNRHVATTLQEKMALHLNMRPDSQVHTEKWGGHYASFVAPLHLLHNITNEQETFCLNFESSCYEKCGGKAIIQAPIINRALESEMAIALHS